MWLYFLIGAVLLNASSGVPGVFMRRRSGRGQTLATVMVATGCALGLAAAVAVLTVGGQVSSRLPGPLPDLSLHFRLDPLGAFFLAPICLVGAVGAGYRRGY